VGGGQEPPLKDGGVCAEVPAEVPQGADKSSKTGMVVLGIGAVAGVIIAGVIVMMYKKVDKPNKEIDEVDKPNKEIDEDKFFDDEFPPDKKIERDELFMSELPRPLLISLGNWGLYDND
jgi:hypothetical protein